MFFFRVRRLLVGLMLCGLLAGVLPGSRPQVAMAVPFSFPTINTVYNQSFDTLSISGSHMWTNDSTLAGWYSNRIVYIADAGTSNAGGLHSYGPTTGTSTDRALGSIASGSVDPVLYGVVLTNNTGLSVNYVAVSYFGEQWRAGLKCITPRFVVANACAYYSAIGNASS